MNYTKVEDFKLSRKVLYYFAIDSMYVDLASLGARGVVYCGNGYACYARATQCRSAGRTYIAERLYSAVGRADMPSISDFQKLISR